METQITMWPPPIRIDPININRIFSKFKRVWRIEKKNEEQIREFWTKKSEWTANWGWLLRWRETSLAGVIENSASDVKNTMRSNSCQKSQSPCRAKAMKSYERKKELLFKGAGQLWMRRQGCCGEHISATVDGSFLEDHQFSFHRCYVASRRWAHVSGTVHLVATSRTIGMIDADVEPRCQFHVEMLSRLLLHMCHFTVKFDF